MGLAIARYALARAGLVAVIAVVLVLLKVPLLVALLVALVAAVPLSLLVFRGLRTELNQALAAAGQRRGAQKKRLRAQLRGEQVDEDLAEPAQQSERGEPTRRPESVEPARQPGRDEPAERPEPPESARQLGQAESAQRMGSAGSGQPGQGEPDGSSK